MNRRRIVNRKPMPQAAATPASAVNRAPGIVAGATPTMLCLSGEATWLEAAAGEDKPALPRFSMVANTGKPMDMAFWNSPVVVDLAGMTIRSQTLPIRRGHDRDRVVGHSESVSMEEGRITAKGVLSFETADAKEIADAGRNGFPWQASIGASIHALEFVGEGVSVALNGQQFEGPLNVVRKSTLEEISFVDIGADRDTSARLAAQAKHQEDLNVKKKIQLADGTVVEVAPEEAERIEAEAVVARLEAEAKVPTPEEQVKQVRAQVAAETKRIAAVGKAAGRHPEIAAQAVEEGWDLSKTELEVLRAERPSVPKPGLGEHGVVASEILEAAMILSTGLPHPEKHYKPEVLEAAEKRFKRQMGLQELILEAAWANGYTGHSFLSGKRECLQAAFSTMSLPGILSNIASKSLLQGFEAVESSWRSIAAIANVRDFKQISSYRLTGGLESEEVAPDGELKHGDLGELTYVNQAKTYGKMLSITRTDIINDDLRALAQVPMKLGRGAALKFNKVLWTEFMDNLAFFAAGNNNFASGAGTALSSAALTQALTLFRNQTDPDGNPIAVDPMILLVPNALEITALELMRSLEVRDTTAGMKAPTQNVFAGRFQVVQSTYLSLSSIPGFSPKKWYLLAMPQDMPVIEVVFLNGQEQPTVESAEADFNVLGIQMRVFHDFGVKKQEFRGGVAMKGE